MTEMTIREALCRAHHDLMAADDRVILIGEDIVGDAGRAGGAALGGVFGVAHGLHDRFGPARVIDTPISETAFVGMATGAAMTGLKPIVELMFCDFMGVCFDQIFNQAAKARFLSNGRFDLNMTIRATMGAGDGSGAMHSQSLYGLIAQVPGLYAACPSTPADAAGILKSALACPEPVILFEHKGLYGRTGPVDPDLPPVPLGKGRRVRGGNDVSIVAVGAMVPQAEIAAERLAEQGISADVIDPVSIVPLDFDLINASIERTGRLLVVDEGASVGGFADAIVSAVCRRAFRHLKAAPVAITPPGTPVPYGRAAEAAWLPHAKHIERAVRTLIAA